MNEGTTQAEQKVDQNYLPSPETLALAQKISSDLGDLLKRTWTEAILTEDAQIKEAKKLLDGYVAGFEVSTVVKVTRLRPAPTRNGAGRFEWRLP